MAFFLKLPKMSFSCYQTAIWMGDNNFCSLFWDQHPLKPTNWHFTGNIKLLAVFSHFQLLIDDFINFKLYLCFFPKITKKVDNSWALPVIHSDGRQQFLFLFLSSIPIKTYQLTIPRQHQTIGCLLPLQATCSLF